MIAMLTMMSRTSLRRTYQTIRLGFIFGWTFPIAGADLDSSLARSVNSHPPTLALKSAGRNTDNPKPNVVVLIVGRVLIAVSRATVPRIVVPGTAPQQLG
jgi:hypothetical protein